MEATARMIRFLKYAAVAGGVMAAMAGSATAGSLITGAQVKNSSLTGADIKDRSLTARDFRGSLHGAAGRDGRDGQPGAPGVNGVNGAIGPRGEAGPQGFQGPKGDPCVSSDPACRGPKGDKGDQGEQGPIGASGVTGPVYVYGNYMQDVPQSVSLTTSSTTTVLRVPAGDLPPGDYLITVKTQAGASVTCDIWGPGDLAGTTKTYNRMIGSGTQVMYAAMHLQTPGAGAPDQSVSLLCHGTSSSASMTGTQTILQAVGNAVQR